MSPPPSPTTMTPTLTLPASPMDVVVGSTTLNPLVETSRRTIDKRIAEPAPGRVETACSADQRSNLLQQKKNIINQKDSDIYTNVNSRWIQAKSQPQKFFLLFPIK